MLADGIIEIYMKVLEMNYISNVMKLIKKYVLKKYIGCLKCFKTMDVDGSIAELFTYRKDVLVPVLLRLFF